MGSIEFVEGFMKYRLVLLASQLLSGHPWHLDSSFPGPVETSTKKGINTDIMVKK